MSIPAGGSTADAYYQVQAQFNQKAEPAEAPDAEALQLIAAPGDSVTVDDGNVVTATVNTPPAHWSQATPPHMMRWGQFRWS